MRKKESGLQILIPNAAGLQIRQSGCYLFLRLSQIVWKYPYLLRCENARLGIIAQIVQFAAQFLVKVNPSVEASPSGVGAEVREVELCQFSATVCPNHEHRFFLQRYEKNMKKKNPSGVILGWNDGVPACTKNALKKAWHIRLRSVGFAIRPL